MKLIGELQLPYGVESSIAHQNVVGGRYEKRLGGFACESIFGGALQTARA